MDTITSKLNRAARRKAKAEDRKTQTVEDDFSAVEVLVSEAHERVTALLDGVRLEAEQFPDATYTLPLLLISPKLTAFGEGETVAKAFAKVMGGAEEPFHSTTLKEELGGKTKAEMASLFFADEAKMFDALVTVSMSFAMFDAGLATEETVRIGAEHLGKVYQMLGIKHTLIG